MWSSYFFVFAATGLSQLSFCATIYASPTGSDSGTGTIASPLKSIQSAVNLATAGSTIFLRAGTYAPTTNIQFAKSGTASAPYTLSAYGTEKVIIDGEGMPKLINGPYGIYQRDASNNYFERIITRDNYETGFQIQGASVNNVVLYLDSHGNRDPRKNGEGADGFACKEGTGAGNLLKGARLWNNVDDGLDLWEFKSAVTIQDTIAWGNGFNRWGFSNFAGDGNGFKLGGGNAGDIGPANHNVTNCIAFLNAAKGFTDNSQTGNFLLNRNTAWNNGDMGFKLSISTGTLRNNIAAANKGSAQVSLSSSQVQSSNSWNVGGMWNNGSFKSVDTKPVVGPRATNGKILASDFLLPVSGATIGATTFW